MSETFTLEQVIEGTDDNPELFTLDEVSRDVENPDFTEVKQLGYFSSMKHAFLRGNRSSSLDTQSYKALIGGGREEYLREVKPEKDRFYQEMTELRLDESNWAKKATLSVSEMIPAMAKGTFQGLAGAVVTGGAFAGGAAVLGQLGPQAVLPEEVVTIPGAFAYGFGKGKLVGSMQYWYRQGAGSLYSDLKEEGISDDLAKPVSHFAGALYGAIEFMQVDKLIPGAKSATRQLVVASVKKTMANMAKRYGANWLQEVGEEGLQEMVLEASKEISKAVEGKTNARTGAIVQKTLIAGWNAVKESAIPMLILLGPSAAVDVKRAVDISKEKQIPLEHPAEAPIVEPEAIPQGKEGIVEPEAKPQAGEVELIAEAKKYKTAEEFIKSVRERKESELEPEEGEIDETDREIRDKISREDFEKIVERFFPQVKEFYEDEGVSNFRDY